MKKTNIILMSLLLLSLAESLAAQEISININLDGNWLSECEQITHTPRAFAASRERFNLKEGKFTWSLVAFTDTDCTSELMVYDGAEGSYMPTSKTLEANNKQYTKIIFDPTDPFNGAYGELTRDIYANTSEDTLDVYTFTYQSGGMRGETITYTKK